MSIYLILESQFDEMHLHFPIYRLDVSDDSTLGNNLLQKSPYTTKNDTLVMSMRLDTEDVYEVYASLQTEFNTRFRRHKEFGIAYYSGDVHVMCDLIYDGFVRHRTSRKSRNIAWYNRL